jgi:hypothetical protein
MTTWPHDPPSAGKLTEQDLEAAIRASWPPRRAAAPCATCRTAKACPAPQSCLQPDTSQPKPDGLVRAYNALRKAVRWPYIAALKWQRQCLREDREIYELSGAGRDYLANSRDQEQALNERIKKLEADQ